MIGSVDNRTHKDRVIGRNIVHFKDMKLASDRTNKADQVSSLC